MKPRGTGCRVYFNGQRPQNALGGAMLLMLVSALMANRGVSAECPLVMVSSSDPAGTQKCVFPTVQVPAGGEVKCGDYFTTFPTTLIDRFSVVAIQITTAARDAAGGFECPKVVSSLKKMANGNDGCSFNLVGPPSDTGIKNLKPVCSVTAAGMELGYTFTVVPEGAGTEKNASPFGWEGCENTILDRQLEAKKPPGCDAPGALLVGFQVDDKNNMQTMNEFQCCNVAGNVRHYANCYLENVMGTETAMNAKAGDPVPLTCTRKGYYLANFYLKNDQIQCCRIADMPMTWFECAKEGGAVPWTKCSRPGHFVRSLEITHSSGDRLLGKGSHLESVECCGVCPLLCKNQGALFSDQCKCDCPAPWSGNSCEICNMECLNGGMKDDTSCSCDCTDHWTGNQCETCSIKCLNGGTPTATCECACPAPWTGHLCDECPLDCGKGSVAPSTCSCDCPSPWSGPGCNTCTLLCEHEGHVDGVKCACVCQGNWSGPTCHDCTAQCENGAVMNTDTCTCGCTNSWSGPTCQDCNIKCRHDGFVENNPASCKCTCEGTWEGKKCDTCDIQCASGTKDDSLCICKCDGSFTGKLCDQCKSQCLNGGTLNQEPCKCNCAGAWEGSFCEVCGLTCSHGKLDKTLCKCLCEEPWVGTECDNCGIDKCANGGTLDQKLCQCGCHGPFVGPKCDQCQKLSCSNGGQMDPSTCVCKCAGQFSGDKCDKCDIACEHGGTANGGTCTCTCVSPWSGTRCETCGVTCGAGGTLDNKYCKCNCDVPWLGDLCDQCTLTCRNGGTLDQSKCACTCLDPWSGDECNSCTLICLHKGTRNASSCLCDCVNPWTGTNCGKCPLQCKNGGILNGKTCSCSCVPPWIGEECTECLLDCGKFGDRNSVTCSCHCRGGFTGSDCASCKLECMHGTIVKEDGCACKCDPLWSGKLCDHCDAASCLNGGTMDLAACKCNCAGKWEGIDCSQCGLHCQNDGRMTFYEGCDSCLCKPGWAGAECTQQDKPPVAPGGGRAHGAQSALKLVPLKWGYDEKSIGPSKWGVVGTMCQYGRHQSPIALQKSVAIEDPSLGDLSLSYNGTAAEAMFTGWTVQVNFDAGETPVPPNPLGGTGSPPGNCDCGAGTMTIGLTGFKLVNVHFHWPSEHIIDGVHADMELHLVHQGIADQTSLAVVAILLKVGVANMEMSKFFDYVRADGTPIKKLRIDPTHFFPNNLDYFAYDGSISTPPCVENVQYIVLKTFGTVSQEHYSYAKSLMATNSRPVQNLNHRKVRSHTHRTPEVRKLRAVLPPPQPTNRIIGDFALVPNVPDAPLPPAAGNTPLPDDSHWPTPWGHDNMDCNIVPC